METAHERYKANLEFYARSDKAKALARQSALSIAINSKINSNSYVEASPKPVFGKKWEKCFRGIKDNLTKEYDGRLESLFLISARMYIYASEAAAGYIKYLIELGGRGNLSSDLMKQLSSPEGYTDHEGMAYTFYDCLAEINHPSELLITSAFHEFPSRENILNAMSFIWYCDAVHLSSSDLTLAMDFLFEASDCLNLLEGLAMWNTAKEAALEEAENPASIMAKKRHAENYALIEEAKKYWKENIDPNLSAQKAADKLLSIIPLSHKKLAEIVSAEKKKNS